MPNSGFHLHDGIAVWPPAFFLPIHFASIGNHAGLKLPEHPGFGDAMESFDHHHRLQQVQAVFFEPTKHL